MVTVITNTQGIIGHSQQINLKSQVNKIQEAFLFVTSDTARTNRDSRELSSL